MFKGDAALRYVICYLAFTTDYSLSLTWSDMGRFAIYNIQNIINKLHRYLHTQYFIGRMMFNFFAPFSNQAQVISYTNFYRPESV